MKRGSLNFSCLALGLLLAGVTCGAAIQADTGPSENSSSTQESNRLTELSKASQTLYKKISTSLVRVRIENNFGGAASPQLLKEFEEWRLKQGPGTLTPRRERPDRPERPDRTERPDRKPEASATMPSRPGGGIALFRKFLDQKLKDTADTEAQARIRTLLARIEAARAGQPAGTSEFTGIVIDDQGHTLIAWGNTRENAGTTFRATASDGTEVAAKYVGAHVGRGVAVLKLDSPGAAIPLAMASEKLAGGELLMCMTARQGALAWIAAPAPPPSQTLAKRNTDERFPILSNDEHGPTYLFNTSGELAAIGNERFAMPIETLKADVHWIIQNGKDITPRQLGVEWDPVLPQMRKELTALADRPAMLVRKVSPNSPADKAGLKKGDVLLSVDDVSVAYYKQIQLDLATRRGNVQVEILRNGQEKSLDMPLGDK